MQVKQFFFACWFKTFMVEKYFSKGDDTEVYTWNCVFVLKYLGRSFICQIHSERGKEISSALHF